jgi:nucleoside-diphosphate-sugar epimerase
MKVLVTGATGFLGKHVVASFLRRGHQVRAMVRPATDVRQMPWGDKVEPFSADLRAPGDLSPMFDGIDAVIHLAAAVSGDYEAQFNGTVVTTETLLKAMAQTNCRRLILCSSFSIYDYSRVGNVLSEESPLEGPNVYKRRDAYTVSKLWQEKITRRFAAEHKFDLTVLRPGLIWGPDHPYLARVGQSFGPLHLVVGMTRRMPLAYVENCADSFVTAAENPKSIGETFNIVDGHAPGVWRCMGEYLRRTRKRGVRVYLPYWFASTLVRTMALGARIVFGPDVKLPSLVVPPRFQARLKPIRCDLTRLNDVLGWRPPLGFEECLARAFDAPVTAVVPSPQSVPHRAPPLGGVANG